MSAKSNPGDGSHGRGTKGSKALSEGQTRDSWGFLADMVRGLRGLLRS